LRESSCIWSNLGYFNVKAQVDEEIMHFHAQGIDVRNKFEATVWIFHITTFPFASTTASVSLAT